jgi:hypothetical protein
MPSPIAGAQIIYFNSDARLGDKDFLTFGSRHDKIERAQILIPNHAIVHSIHARVFQSLTGDDNWTFSLHLDDDSLNSTPLKTTLNSSNQANECFYDIPVEPFQRISVKMTGKGNSSNTAIVSLYIKHLHSAPTTAASSSSTL